MLKIAEKHGSELSFERGNVVFSQGSEDDNFYVVKHGLLKVFYTTADGKEFIKSFIDKEGFIASISAIMKSGKCPYSVVALEESSVLCIPGDFMVNMQDKCIEELEFINKILISVALKKEKREFDFLCLSAEERYIKFMREYKHLESRLNQYDIARYLGITNVALSRIKKRVGLC